MKNNKKVLLVLASVVLAGILSGCNVNNPSSNMRVDFFYKIYENNS
jgi:hypothetical protein